MPRRVQERRSARQGADLQLCAQALCLEEMLGADIAYGHVWFAGPRRRTTVRFTPQLRDEVRCIIRQIRAQMVSGVLPGAVDDERCNECQLLHHCLSRLSGAPRKVHPYMDDVVFACDT